MLIRRPDAILPSEITAPGLYRERRRFMGLAGSLALAGALPSGLARAATSPIGSYRVRSFRRCRCGPGLVQAVARPCRLKRS